MKQVEAIVQKTLESNAVVGAFRCAEVLPIMAFEGWEPHSLFSTGLESLLVQSCAEDDSFDPKHTAGYIKALPGLLDSKKE